MITRSLGTHGPEVSAIGLGPPMIWPGSSRPSRQVQPLAHATLRRSWLYSIVKEAESRTDDRRTPHSR